MILKKEVKELLGREVKFLTRGMQSEGRMECATGTLMCVNAHTATISTKDCSKYFVGLEDIYLAEEDIPAVLTEKELKELYEKNVQKYMGEMTDMESLLKFPLYYNVQKSAEAWDAYKRGIKAVAGINI